VIVAKSSTKYAVAVAVVVGFVGTSGGCGENRDNNQADGGDPSGSAGHGEAGAAGEGPQGSSGSSSGGSAAAGSGNLPADPCAREYLESGICGPDCNQTCVGDGCTCIQKPCNSFSTDDCPGRCDVVVNCAGDEVCFGLSSEPAGDCGVMGSYDPRIDCCEGLSRSCSVRTSSNPPSCAEPEFGTCLPCGNGDCDPLENECNCPDDCG